MASWKETPGEIGMAFVDTSGKLVDSANFTFVNLRISHLNAVLEEMLRDGTGVKVICPTTGGIPPLAIEKLDGEGKLWRASQTRRTKGKDTPNPEVRFFFQRETGIIRPIDYRDPYVELEGNDRNSQMLISSFMMHWLTGILAFYAEAADCVEAEEKEAGEKPDGGCPSRESGRL